MKCIYIYIYIVWRKTAYFDATFFCDIYNVLLAIPVEYDLVVSIQPHAKVACLGGLFIDTNSNWPPKLPQHVIKLVDFISYMFSIMGR